MFLSHCPLFAVTVLCKMYTPQIFGWDPNGTVVLEDMVCQNNTGVEQGGCISAHGIAVIGEDTYMFGNQGDLGGCICESS